MPGLARRMTGLARRIHRTLNISKQPNFVLIINWDDSVLKGNRGTGFARGIHRVINIMISHDFLLPMKYSVNKIKK